MIQIIKMRCILLLIADTFLLPAMISMKCMFPQLEERYVRAEKFKEEQDKKFKHTHLEVNSPLSVKFIDKVIKKKKIMLRTFCNVSIKDHKSKTINLIPKECHI